jgi:tetratricopeptide (TPR) repeat protein
MHLTATKTPAPNPSRKDWRKAKKMAVQKAQHKKAAEIALERKLQKIQKLVDLGQVQNAYEMLLKVAEGMDDKEHAHRLIGDFFLRHGESAKAYSHFKEAAALGPENAANWFNLALCLFEAEN